MSYETRESIVIALNAIVGFWYVVLSVVFFMAFAQIWRAFAHDTPDANGRAWPDWWVHWGRRFMAAGFTGTSLFLSGCGFHHWHLAFEVVPNAVKLSQQYHLPLHKNLWVGNHFLHHVFIMGGQAIGAPLLLVAGAAAWVAIRQRAKA